MPELPEVETIVRDLRPFLVNRQIKRVQSGRKPLRRKWSAKWNPLLTGKHIQQVQRRGKWIRVDLDDGALLILHLGMTGQLRVVPHHQAVETHTHLIFQLDNGSDLRFRDVRRFGCAFRLPDESSWTRFLAKTLGPEPFDLDVTTWRGTLKKSNRNLKAILLDQRVVAGVGNIYADEACFLARLRPSRRGSSLTARQALTLQAAIIAVLESAIDQRGSTIRDYIGGSGLKGGYQEAMMVYGRTGEQCIRCRTAIRRIRLAGRSTHYCPQCQR